MARVAPREVTIGHSVCRTRPLKREQVLNSPEVTSLHTRSEVRHVVVSVLEGGDIIAGRYVELAVRRYLDDLEHAHERGLYFDAEIAEKSLQFVETVCTHQKAELAGQPFKLSPNQQFIL